MAVGLLVLSACSALVAPPPEFTLSVEPNLVRLPPNGSQYITLSVTPQFSDVVKVSLQAHPYLTAETVAIDPWTAKGTMVLHAIPSAPEGMYQVAVRGEALGYRTTSTRFTLEIFVPGPPPPPSPVFPGLWVSNQGNGSLYVFAQDELDAAFASLDLSAASTEVGVTAVAVEPALVFDTGAVSSPTGIIFDPSNNLWVAHYFEGRVTMYAAEDLGASGPVNPSVTLNFGLVGPEGVTLDAQGNLWVTDYLGDQILMFARGVLGNSQAAPSVVLTGPLLDQPAAVTFDADGNLWVTVWGSDAVLRFAAADLVASGSPVPDLVITHPLIKRPAPLLFERDGDLWLSGFTPVNNASWLLKFNADQLQGPGVPEPAVTLRVDPAQLNGAAGMAFDARGDLWIASFNVDRLVRIAAEDLSSSGTPPIAVVQLAQGTHPVGVRFVPAR